MQIRTVTQVLARGFRAKKPRDEHIIGSVILRRKNQYLYRLLGRGSFVKSVFIVLLAIYFIGSSAFAESELAFLTDYHADCLDLASMDGLYLGRRVSETEVSERASRDQFICSFPSAYFISGYADGFPLLAFYNAYAKEVDLYLWKNGEISKTGCTFPDIEAELILAYVNNWIYYFNETGIYRANGTDVELLYSAEDAGVYLNAENAFFKPAVSEDGRIAFMDNDLIYIEPDGRILRIALERDMYNWGTEKPYDVMPTVVWLNNGEILFFYMVSEKTTDAMHLAVMLADVQTGQISRCRDASGDPIDIENRYVGER